MGMSSVWQHIARNTIRKVYRRPSSAKVNRKTQEKFPALLLLQQAAGWVVEIIS